MWVGCFSEVTVFVFLLFALAPIAIQGPLTGQHIEELKMPLKTSRETSEIIEVLNALRNQAIAFHGPFRTSNGRIVIRIQDQIVVDTELLDLLESGQLNPAGIANLLRKLRTH